MLHWSLHIDPSHTQPYTTSWRNTFLTCSISPKHREKTKQYILSLPTINIFLLVSWREIIQQLHRPIYRQYSEQNMFVTAVEGASAEPCGIECSSARAKICVLSLLVCTVAQCSGLLCRPPGLCCADNKYLLFCRCRK